MGVSWFGAGAAFFASCLKAGVEPMQEADLSRLRAIGATGSPLAEEGYQWIWDLPKVDGRDIWIDPIRAPTLPAPSSAGCARCRWSRARCRAQSGRVLVDGVPVNRVALSALRQRIGIVPQDSTVFSTSALENIRYGRPEASDEEVIAAATAAFAHDFISALPEGYATFLGERGVRISGGQRQRIAIARAMLKNPPLLLLDEATSALDAESERMVQAALEAAMKDRTTLVIAHRLATVQRADRIVVLDHGRVVETGTHASHLLEQVPYKALESEKIELPKRKIGRYEAAEYPFKVVEERF